MLNVAIFIGGIEYFSGGQKYALRLSEELKHMGMGVRIFTYSDRNQKVSINKIRSMTNVEIIQYDTFNLALADERIPLTQSALNMLNELKSADVIYNMDSSIAMNLTLLTFCRMFNKKYIFGLHDPDVFRKVLQKKSLLRKGLLPVYSKARISIYKRIPNIHVISQNQMNELKKIGYKGNIFYIPLFSQFKISYNSIPLNKNKFIVLFVGRLEILQKGLDLLKNIIKNVLELDNEVYFDIVGSGENGESLIHALIKEHPKNIKWLGFVSDSKLKEEYAKANLFIMTSRFEGLPNVLIDAQCFGLPSITFNIEGPNDMITHSFQGRLVKPFDMDEFAGCIIKYHTLWKSKKLNLNLKRNIAKTAQSKYGANAVIPKFYRMLAE